MEGQSDGTNFSIHRSHGKRHLKLCLTNICKMAQGFDYPGHIVLSIGLNATTPMRTQRNKLPRNRSYTYHTRAIRKTVFVDEPLTKVMQCVSY